MADRDDAEKATSDQPAGGPPAAKSEAPAAALPRVEAPSISPAKADERISPEPFAVEPPVGDSPIAPALRFKPLRLALRRRRMAVLAASVAAAAALGAVIGAVGATSLAGTHEHAAGLQERKAMQQTVARLGDELSTLKTNLDAARKSAHAQSTQLAKLSQSMNEKVAAAATKANEALAKASADVTGSIAAPQTSASAEAAVTPLPQPRPQQLAAASAVENAPRLVVPGWHVRGSARGAVLVENRGDIYEVVPGANLPGLGRVESVRRVDGRWIVETPKGLIVSSAPPRDWRYFN